MLRGDPVVWLNDISDRKHVRLTVYADNSEKTAVMFEPLKMSDTPDWNPQWEDWSCYHKPLMIPFSDFEKLLHHKYFDNIYPTVDAFDGTPEESFDVCFHNWIGEQDWRVIINAIRADIKNFSEAEEVFYGAFIEWLEEALKYTSIIIAAGNL